MEGCISAGQPWSATTSLKYGLKVQSVQHAVSSMQTVVFPPQPVQNDLPLVPLGGRKGELEGRGSFYSGLDEDVIIGQEKVVEAAREKM